MEINALLGHACFVLETTYTYVCYILFRDDIYFFTVLVPFCGALNLLSA